MSVTIHLAKITIQYFKPTYPKRLTINQAGIRKELWHYILENHIIVQIKCHKNNHK